MDSPVCLKSQKAENERANFSRYKGAVEQIDNRLAKGRYPGNEEQSSKSQHCMAWNHERPRKNPGKKEEFNDKQGDVQEETRPKQLYGGEEHDEEEKLIQDLHETEKDLEPAAAETGAVRPILVGRVGRSQPALYELVMKVMKISPSEKVLRAVHASVLSKLKSTFPSNIARMNAMNEIVTRLSSVQGKTVNCDLEEAILKEMLPIAPDSGAAKTGKCTCRSADVMCFTVMYVQGPRSLLLVLLLGVA